MTITAYSVSPVAYFAALGVFILIVVIYLGFLFDDVKYGLRDKVTASNVFWRITAAAVISSVMFFLGVSFSETDHKKQELVKFAQTYGIVLPSYSTQQVKIPSYHEPAATTISAYIPGEEDLVECLVVVGEDRVLSVLCNGSLLQPVR